MYINEIDVKNKVYNYYFYNLIKAKNIKTKNILISKENYKDLKIYFTRYVYKKLKKMWRLHYHELMRKIEEHKGKKYLMVHDYTLIKN